MAALALHVSVGEDTALRVASTGTGDEQVTWTLDGVDVAWTDDRHAAHVTVLRGEHALWAASAVASPWSVLARADAPGDGQATFVPAWSASHPAEPRQPFPVVPAALALAGLAVAAGRGRSLLEARRRARLA